MLLPRGRFADLWRALGAKGSEQDAFERLRSAYDEPGRAYHSASHIVACLRLLDDSAVRALAAHPAEVEAALWFHDAIYDTHAGDSEERSASLAETCLRGGCVPEEVAARIAEHVRATKDHFAATQDGRLVIDIDLSILAADDATFLGFEGEVRREYGWVDPVTYGLARASVLKRFLDRPNIYLTPLFHARYEARARANMVASLARMARPAL